MMEKSDNRPTIGVINIICGGTSASDDSPQEDDPLSKKARIEDPIIFFAKKLNEPSTPQDDPIVVSLTIAKYDVHHILIDNESSTDILFYDAFVRMKIHRAQLQKINAPLVDFIGSSVQVEGAVNLPMMAGTELHQSTVKLTFLLVRVSSAYNGILRRPGLNTLRDVVSTYHLLMRFSTSVGIGEVRGDQMVAR